MGFVVKAVKKVVKTVVGVVSKVVGGVFGFFVGGGKSAKAKAVNTLNKSLEPESYRKIVLGKIASPLDVRYWEVWGTKGQNFDEIIALAGHRVNAVLDLYFEEKLAFSAGSATPTAAFTGVVSRASRVGVDNQTGMAAGGGTRWGIASTFDGCAYIKLAWIPDEKKLPNGIPNTYRQVVEGALVYDPRRDSTRGGSGTHRADDRSTWAYATLDGNGQPIGRNNALQALWYLLGWTVPTKNAGGTVTGERLVCGRGVDPEDINFATFIAGANACETAGYYTDVVLSTEEAHTSNEDKITCNGLIGRLIDPGGLWSYYANVDDTASIAVDLTDADILQGDTVSWNEYKGMSDQFNQVRGKFVYPASPVLYQAYPYPMVRDATYETNLGTKRAKPLDFEQVLDSTLAQRLARLFLNEGQYQGEFKASFNYKALRAQAWSVVRYTSDRFGFVKLFRVYRQDISTDSGVGMLLKEIHSSIWSAGTVTPPMAPGLGLAYEATQEIAATGVTKTLVNFDGPDGTKGDGFRISWDAPPNAVRRTEIHYRLSGTTSWITDGPVERDITSIQIGPLYSGALYEAEVRHISINEIAGPWVAVTGGVFATGSYGNINFAAIAAAGGTASWSGITGVGKPSDNAGTTITLYDRHGSQYSIVGNTVTRTSTNGVWYNVYSRETYMGTAFISCKLATPTIMMGFVTAATDSDYTILKYAFYRGSGSNYYVYVNGAVDITMGSAFNGVTFTNDTVFLITYNGVKITMYADGVVMAAYDASASNIKYTAAISTFAVDSKATDIQFGPFSQNDWSTIGGPNRPADNAGSSGVLTAIGTFTTIVGNSSYKTGGTHGAWQGGTVGMPLTGTAYIASAGVRTITSGGYYTTLALDDSATQFDLAQQKYACIVIAGTTGSGAGTLYIYKDGSLITSQAYTGATTESQMLMFYDGVRVVGKFANATVETTSGVTSGMTFYPKTLDYFNNTSAHTRFNIVSGPWSENNWATIGGGGKPEDDSDVTIYILPFATIARVFANSDGSIKTGELPVNWPFKLKRGPTADITTSATWTATLISGDATFTMGAATGFLNVTALDATSVVEANANYGGTDRKIRMTIEKVLDLPPNEGGSGSGTSANTSTHTGPSSTSYGSPSSAIISVKAGSGGIVTLSAPLVFKRNTSTLGTSQIYGKWQWRIVGGSFADVNAEVLSGTARTTQDPGDPLINTSSTLNVNTSKNSLTNGTSYEFRLVYRNNSGTIPHTIAGTATGTGS